MGNLPKTKSKINHTKKNIVDINISHKTTINHKARVLSKNDVIANRSNAYSFLSL